MINRAFLAVVLLCLAAMSGRAAETVSAFYVAPNGNDAWSGRWPDRNAAKTDGPFATITRARDALREHRKQSGTVGGTVLLRGGVYRIEAALVLSPEDSGTETAPVTFAAYEDETPIVSGGRVVDQWEEKDGRWHAVLPAVKSGDWNFIQLYVNGEPRMRPRLPATGWYRVEAELPSGPDANGKPDRFQFAAGNLDAKWSNLSDVEVLAMHVWTISRMRIKSIDETARQVLFTGTSSHAKDFAKFAKGKPFVVENVREALDAPGEWYLDRPSGELTYIPKPGEHPSNTKVVAPVAPQLLVMAGEPADGRWVQHVVFRGIQFQHANWITPPQGHAFPQADVDIPAAISAIGARQCVFEKCSVSHVGGYGIELGAGSCWNTISDCELTELGGGGIKIAHSVVLGSPKPQTEEEFARENLVKDCLIEGGGRLHPASVGVWIGPSPRNRIEHNEISDLLYTGVSLGWSWGYKPSAAEGNLLAFNRISHIGQGVLSDMGGIYTLGNAPGNVLRSNFISAVDSSGYGGWGIYFDEGSSAFLAENNVVFRTKSAGFHQHYGRENVVRNNIFAFGREAQVMRTRDEKHLSFTIESNVILSAGTPFFGSKWKGTSYHFARNLYWDETGKQPDFPDASDLAAWQAKGQDADSIIADPLFENASKGDFRIKPGSPLEKIGFKEIDLSTVGRRTARRIAAKNPAPAFQSLSAP